MANEKRLIDAKAGKKVFSAIAQPAEYKGVIHMVVPISEIDKLPTVDAVEVVRCEKCKHAVWDEEYEMWKCVESAEYDEEMGVWFGFCEYHNGDFFCADGERKEDG